MSIFLANSSFGTHAPWIFLDGFPLILNVVCWVGFALIIAQWWGRRRALGRDKPTQVNPSKPLSPSARQNQTYKRGGALLLVIGALFGFGPSLVLLAVTGKAWSVNRVQPHTDVDASIVIHIPLAVIWSIAFAIQLWSGGIGSRRTIHRIAGWVTVASGLVGISLAAGWIWTYFNDFAEGLSGPRANAGIYTIILGLGVAVNIVLLVVHARRHNYLGHKDHALMALFWALDPGVHRAMMWGMRLIDWDCWAPENTAGMGIALAKLPANLLLISWALTVATRAGRVNAVILANVTGQLLLFLFSSHGLMIGSLGPRFSTFVVSTTIFLGVCSFLALARMTKKVDPRPAVRQEHNPLEL